MPRLMLIVSLVLSFTSAHALNPAIRSLRFQNTGSAIVVDDCSEAKCRHMVTLTPELTRLLRKTISAAEINQIPLTPEDEAAIKTYGRIWKLGAISVGLLAALFTLQFNPLFAAAVFTDRFAGWSAAILHFGLIEYGFYKFGGWIQNQRHLSVRASRRDQLARAFDQLIAEVYAQIPPGHLRTFDIPEGLAQQLDLSHEPQLGTLSRP